jgi:prepilin peptidase CpaA
MKDFSSLFKRLGMLLSNPRFSTLFALLMVAAISDCRTHKIQNWLTFGGSAFVLIYSEVISFSSHRSLVGSPLVTTHA